MSDLAGLELREGKVNDGFGAFGPEADGPELNKDGALVCAEAVVAADCPPRF